MLPTRLMRRAVHASYRSCTTAAVNTDVAEDERLQNVLKKVKNHLDNNNKAQDGAFALGKELCNVLKVPHPKFANCHSYQKVLETSGRKQLSSLKQAESKKSLPLESELSCFHRTPHVVKLNKELKEKYNQYLVLDFETTIKQMHKRKASPFTPLNRIVYTAWSKPGVPPTVRGPFADRDGYKAGFPSLDDINVIVGHNIKFDLLYIWDNQELKDFFKRGGLVWDTMYAEYLLNGHKDIGGLSLDAVSLNYGGEQKDNYIAEQWKKGVDTPDIDPERLIEYARGDVKNTEMIFQGQLELLSEGMRLPLIMGHMEGLLATTEMEYNGLYVSQEKYLAMREELEADVAKAEKELQSIFTPPEIVALNKRMRKELASPAEFNWGSHVQLKSYLFGGKASFKVKILEKKKGEDKIVNRSVDVEFKGIVPQEWRIENEDKHTKSPGQWKVSDDVITAIADRYAGEPWAEAIGRLRRIKKGKKLISTYLNALGTLVDSDSILHPQLNHVVTRTGRLSSANPNMQNVPRGRTSIKNCLRTRFMCADGTPQGVMIESDYSQLEVFVMALLSQDETLMNELETGSDLHCKRLARMKNMPYEEVYHLCKEVKDPYWTGERTKAKVFSFQRQYGAGNKMIATTTGLSMEEVQLLVNNEKVAYPKVDQFFERVTQALKETAARGGRSEGWYDAPSGNRWYFEAEQSRRMNVRSKNSMEFRRQLVLNHPVQGYAAEIVLVCLGRLWRFFLENGNFSETRDFTTPARALMVNTVHDCVWVDAKEEVRDEVAKEVERILADVRGAYADFGYHIPTWVNFKTETTWGVSMAEV